MNKPLSHLEFLDKAAPSPPTSPPHLPPRTYLCTFCLLVVWRPHQRDIRLLVCSVYFVIYDGEVLHLNHWSPLPYASASTHEHSTTATARRTGTCSCLTATARYVIYKRNHHFSIRKISFEQTRESVVVLSYHTND